VTLLSVEKDGKCIGSAFLLASNNTVFVLQVACKSATFRYFPVTLLYYSILCWGKERGYAFVDFGRSQPGSGTERFKLSFKANIKPLYSYGIKRLEIDSPLGRLATSWCQIMPYEVLNFLSPIIRRYIPFG
jgi:hypothetical protein